MPVIEDNPYRLPRTVIPSRYDVELAPDLAAASFSGTVRIEIDIVEADGGGGAQRDGARDPIDRPRAGRRPAGPGRGDLRARRVDRAHDHPGGQRPSAGPSGPDHRVRRRAERSSPRVLPFHLHRRRRRRAGHRDQPDAGDRLPQGVPVLGRAGLQGGLRRHPRGRRRAAGDLERPRDLAGAPAGSEGGDPLRRHDGHVVVPRGVRGRSARGDRTRRRRRASRCDSSTFPARVTSPPSASMSARSRCAGSRSTTASPIPGRRSISSRCPTSPPERWRTLVASRFARACSSSIPPRAPRPSRRSLPTS